MMFLLQQGYLNNKEETDKVLTEDGWVKTGDMFYRDEQDYYYYVERKRLLIKHTGLWVSLYFSAYAPTGLGMQTTKLLSDRNKFQH